jgi:hypothetical protein
MGVQFMAKGKDLQPAEIDRLLQDLGNELAASGFTAVRVMMVGGAYMLLNIGNRATTQDIDVFPLNFASSANPDKNTKTILKAIGAVAKRNSLRRDWFNDAAFGIIGELQPPAQELTLWKTYGALEISMPPAEFILAVKIFGYRSRDYNDVAALMEKLNIQTKEQAQQIIDRYIDRKAQEEYRTQVTLDDLFEE